MANKFPLILNTTTSTIQELPAGDNLDLSGSNISNVANITAGNSVSANYFVGSLYGQANTAIQSQTVTDTAQPNITSLGTLTSLQVLGTSEFGSVDNITITGGTANFVLQTDGLGNLTWAAQSGGGGAGETFNPFLLAGM